MGTERIIGYILLGVGLGIVIYSVVMAYSYLTGAMPVPQFFEAPDTNGGTIPSSLFTDISNVLMLFVMLFIILLAGSIISSRGVSLIKEVKLKVVREVGAEKEEVS